MLVHVAWQGEEADFAVPDGTAAADVIRSALQLWPDTDPRPTDGWRLMARGGRFLQPREQVRHGMSYVLRRLTVA